MVPLLGGAFSQLGGEQTHLVPEVETRPIRAGRRSLVLQRAYLFTID